MIIQTINFAYPTVKIYDIWQYLDGVCYQGKLLKCLIYVGSHILKNIVIYIVKLDNYRITVNI